MSDYTLSESLTTSLETQTERAIQFTEDNDYVNAAAILNEWTLAPGGCMLTHYLNGSLQSIKEQLVYASLSDDSLEYGTFSFVEPVQLPTDNI